MLFERLLVFGLAFGAFSFGAVYPWGYWPIGGLALALGLWALRHPAPDPDRSFRTLTVALIAVATAIALQAVPLPRSIFLALAGGAERFLQQHDVGYAFQPPGTHTLSLDPVATFTTLALFGAFSVLLLGLSRGSADARLDRIVRSLVFLGVVMATAGIVQRAAVPPRGAHLVYGFWEPQFKGDPFGPFINRNHFAGWMLLALPLAMGYSLAVLHRHRPPLNSGIRQWLRWLITPDASRFAFVMLAVLVMGTSLALTQSRSGIVGFLAAVLVLAVAMCRHARRPFVRALVLSYAGVLAGGALLWAGLATTLTRFSLTAADLPARWSAWQDTLRIIADFPLFGVGLGNYGLAMLIYQTGHRSTMFAQAHNDYLQLLAEGGILVVIPALACFVVIARLIRRRLDGHDESPYEYWIRVGAVAALVGIALQSLVEFSLQMPANALLFVVVLAIAIRPRLRAHAHRV